MFVCYIPASCFSHSHLVCHQIEVCQILRILLELAGDELLLGQDVVNVPVVTLIVGVRVDLFVRIGFVGCQRFAAGQKNGVQGGSFAL